MKRLAWLALVALVTLTVSCATNSFPPKKTSDDCLVLVRTTIVNKDNSPIAREYRFVLSPSNTTFAVPNDSEGFVIFMIREPGARIIGLTSQVNMARFTGESFDEPLDFELPYKHGEVVVADFTFTQTIEKTSEYHYTSRFDFQKTPDDSKAAILEKFRKMEGAQSWQ
jgi:hypothetical protein